MRFDRLDLKPLVQGGRRMLLTPKAEELIAPVRRALLQIRSEITRPTGFEPRTVQRRFVIVASDYAFTIFVAQVIRTAAALAPGVTFEIINPDRLATDRLERAEVDVLITVTPFVVSGHPQVLLFDDEEVVISCPDAGYGHIDEDAYFAAGHVIAMFGKDRHPSVSDNYLTDYPRQRRIEVRVPSFTELPTAIAGTRRLAIMHRRLAEHLASCHPLVIHPAPIPLPRIQEVAQWHRLRDKDAGVRLSKDKSVVFGIKILNVNRQCCSVGRRHLGFELEAPERRPADIFGGESRYAGNVDQRADLLLLVAPVENLQIHLQATIEKTVLGANGESLDGLRLEYA